MSTATEAIADAAAEAPPSAAVVHSPGFWRETWKRFRRRKLSMAALLYIVLLTVVALLAPLIAGTRPIICKYKGAIYFPCLAYYNRSWEPTIFMEDRFYQIYPKNLQKNDSDSWAVWPLVYQDPYRRVRADEFPGRPETPIQGAPSQFNWFGTNQSGYDVFAIMVHGTLVALLVGFVSMGIAAAIGMLLGAIAGFARGWVDVVICRFIDVVLCVPTLVLIIVMVNLVARASIWHVMAVLGLTGWPSIARLMRGEFLKLREAEFVTAARALGAGPPRIIFRHILPNSLAPVLVPITFGIAGAILAESALSFLGFGPPPPNPSWGTVLQAGKENLDLWWLVVFPGMAIFLTVLAYNLIGEGLQEATDPRLRDAGR